MYILPLSTQGFSKPIDEYLNCTEGAIYVAGKMKQVSSIIGTVTGLVASCWLTTGMLATMLRMAMNARYNSKCECDRVCMYCIYV